jgi:hypothetical protein
METAKFMFFGTPAAYSHGETFLPLFAFAL